MANRLIKLAQVVYMPAVQAVIARPARCLVETVRRPVTTWVDVYSPEPGWVPTQYAPADPDHPEVGSSLQPVKWVMGTVTTHRKLVTLYETVSQTVCYPAINGRDGRDAGAATAPPGWDSGARSIDAYSGDVYFSFAFNPEGVGVVCGLTPVGMPVDEYGAVSHGFLLDNGVVSVVESGAVRVSWAFDPDLRPIIRRVGTQVAYSYGGWYHESDVLLSGVVVAQACMYTAGDYVSSPVVAPIRQLQVYSDWDWMDRSSANRVTTRVGWGWASSATIGDGYVELTLELQGRISDYDYSEIVADVGGVNARMSGNPIISTTGVQVVVPMDLYAQAIYIGGGEVVVDAGGVIGRISDYEYNEVVYEAVDVRLFAFEFAEPPGTGTEADLLTVVDTYTTDPVVYAVLHDMLLLGDTLEVLIALDASLVDYLNVADTANASMVLVALLASNLQITDNASLVRSTLLQYTTNVLTGAVGRYEGFDFSGFVRCGVDTYGWKRDGLYRMAYAEDTGEEIQAMIDFAAEDFDTTHRKSVRALFFGVDTDGALYARLVDDNDCDATYRVIPHGDTQRANPAQRPTSRFWRLRLEIVDATFADLDNVEWKAATTGRRTRS